MKFMADIFIFLRVKIEINFLKNLKKREIEYKIFYSPLASEAPIFKTYWSQI